MRLIDELIAEHRVIEKVIGSLRAFASQWQGTPDEVAHGRVYLEFFTQYAGALHHAKEEEVLFPALQREVGVSVERGPIHAMMVQHHDMAALLQTLGGLFERGAAGGVTREQVLEVATKYGDSLLKHIDAEDSVLFPECLERFRRVYVHELDDVPTTARQQEARDAALRLVARFEPIENPDLLRGDGCVACPSFGHNCQGLEAEWWNDHEWDELPDRAQSD